MFEYSPHPTWGSDFGPQGQESYAPLAEPAGRPGRIFLTVANHKLLLFSSVFSINL